MSLSFHQDNPGHARSRGFSLAEAVVASAILLMTAASVTGVIIASLRAERAEAAQADLEQSVQTELARLGALPFVAPAAAPGLPGGEREEPRSLLEAVFPHALVAQNAASGFYVPATSDAPCSFVTVRESSWGTLRLTCSFMCFRGDTWQATDAGDVDGWAIWRQATPPSSAVRITVEATATGGARRRERVSLILDALRPRIVEPAS
jgi:Tfp pilus assembly protein PilV